MSFLKIILASVLLSTLTLFAEDTIGNKPANTLEYHLAFSINPAHNSGFINFAIIGINNNKVIYTKYINVSEFILVGMGRQTSPANEIGTNLFEDHKIKECLYKYDSTQCLKIESLTLHDLWALRYNRNPFCPPDCIPADKMLVKGFSQHKSHPSWPQLQILQNYGITYINDFFYGDNMFKLFSDFQKQNWLDTFIASTE